MSTSLPVWSMALILELGYIDFALRKPFAMLCGSFMTCCTVVQFPLAFWY